MFSRNTSTGVYSTNSIFTKNANNINSIMSSTYIQNNALIDLYKKLATYATTVSTLLTEYMKGNFAVVASILTPANYNLMSMQLNTLAQDPNKYPQYEQLRISITTSLGGMYQSILQYGTLLDTQTKLDNCAKCEEILNDPKKLQEYINKLKSSLVYFHESKVTIIAATLKPEYQEYIRLYGFPPGAVFESDKLAEVFKRLNMAF